MKNKSLLTTLAVLVMFAVGFAAYTANALTQARNDTSHDGVSATHEFIDGATANSTSTGKIIGGTESVTLFFHRDGPNGSGNGTSTFSIQVSLDGSEWVTYNKLISNVTNSNSQQLTRVGSVALTGTTTESYTMDLTGDGYYSMRCVVVEETDGTHQCDAWIEE